MLGAFGRPSVFGNDQIKQCATQRNETEVTKQIQKSTVARTQQTAAKKKKSAKKKPAKKAKKAKKAPKKKKASRVAC